MHVAVVVDYLHARGGTQRQALALAGALQKRGHRVTVVTRYFNKMNCFPELTQNLDIVAENNHSPTPFFAASTPLRGRKAEWITNVGRIIAGETGKQILSTAKTVRATTTLVRLLRQIDNENSIDLINPHDFGPAVWGAIRAAKHLHVPVVWQCNDPFLKWSSNKKPQWIEAGLNRLLLGIDRVLIRGADVVTVLDSTVAKVVESRYGITPKIVRSGVDWQSFVDLPSRGSARRDLGLPENAPVALVLTLLNSRHRHVEDAIRAIEINADRWPLWLLLVAPRQKVGSSEYQRQVEDLVNRSPIKSRIVWLDRHLQNEKELKSVFAASDFFLFPNVEQTWGLAVLEAAAAGLPVIVSDGAGVSEVLADKRNAIIYRGGNISALAEAVDWALGHPELLSVIGKQAREYVQSRFSWDRYAEEMDRSFLAALDMANRRISPR